MSTMREILTGGLRLINAVQANETPSAQDMDITLKAMNGLVDSLSNDILNIYTFSPYRFPLVQGQLEYKLGPALDVEGNQTNVDWVIQRPMRIEQAKVLLYGDVTARDDSNTGTGSAATPIPDFVGVPLSGEASLSVSFTDLSTGFPDTWSWDFGDAAGSTLQNPTHVYDTPGTYSVSLTVSTDGSSSNLTKEDYIDVQVPVPTSPFAYVFNDFSFVTFGDIAMGGSGYTGVIRRNGVSSIGLYTSTLGNNLQTSQTWAVGGVTAPTNTTVVDAAGSGLFLAYTQTLSGNTSLCVAKLSDISTQTWGKTFARSSESQLASGKPVALTDGGVVLPYRSVTTASVSYSGIQRLDASGTVLWGSKTEGVSVAPLADVAPDGSIYTLIAPSGTSSTKAYLTKQAADGTVVWQTTITPDPSYPPLTQLVYGSVRCANGSIYVLQSTQNGSHIIKFSAAGTITGQLQLSATGFLSSIWYYVPSFTVLADDSFVVPMEVYGPSTSNQRRAWMRVTQAGSITVFREIAVTGQQLYTPVQVSVTSTHIGIGISDDAGQAVGIMPLGGALIGTFTYPGTTLTYQPGSSFTPVATSGVVATLSAFPYTTTAETRTTSNLTLTAGALTGTTLQQLA